MKSPALRDVTLGELVELDAGFAFKSAQYTEAHADIKLLRGDNIGQGALRWEGVKRWPKSDAHNHTRYELRVDDVVLAMDRPWIEAGLKFAAVRQRDLPCLLVQRVARLRAKQGLHQGYLRYVIGSKAFTDHVKSITTGVNVPHISGRDISAFKLSLPSFDIQQRVSEILSAYDDLIEVNQRRIPILEGMARRLFDEWFVRFRYPGHEAIPLVETELGAVPEGWTPGTIADLSSFISRGLAPRYDDEASSLVINQKCIRDQSLNLSPARKQSKPIPPSKLVIDGDILINSTGVGTLGRVAQLLGALPNATVDTHVTIVRAVEQVDLHYFGLQLLQLQPHFERQGIGATGQTELSRTAIADTKIIIPTYDLVSRFGRIAGPLRCQAELLRNQNNKLRAARDLLLPKLISGQIDVSDAEETFSEAAE